MKVLDSTIIIAEVQKQIEETDYDVTTLIGKALTTLVVMGIYLTNDICSGYGQDFGDLKISFISSPKRISVIMDGKASWFQSDDSICIYESLSEDINQILMVMQAAIDRIDE